MLPGCCAINAMAIGEVGCALQPVSGLGGEHVRSRCRVNC